LTPFHSTSSSISQIIHKQFALALSAIAVAAALEARFVGLQANPTHYGDPTTGCMSDEMNVTVTGLTGDFCSPPCDASQNCPTDVPTGCKAVGQCVLDVNGGANPTYCALICDP